MFEEVSRLGHVKVSVSKVLRVAELAEQDAHLLTRLGRQNHIRVVNSSVLKATAHGRVTVVRETREMLVCLSDICVE